MPTNDEPSVSEAPAAVALDARWDRYAAGELSAPELASLMRDMGNDPLAHAAQTLFSPLSDALRASRWFPALMLFMIAAGERSGALGEMFRRAADQTEQEIDGTVTVGLNLLEPGIILVLGLVVVLIVLSILLPILQLNTLALG